MSTFELIFLVVGCIFLVSSTAVGVLGALFDFWIEKRHLKTVGQPLMGPTVPLPLLTGFYCGMRLIAPNLGISRGHDTTIHLASPGVQRLARINAVALITCGISGVLMWLLTRL